MQRPPRRISEFPPTTVEQIERPGQDRCILPDTLLSCIHVDFLQSTSRVSLIL